MRGGLIGGITILLITLPAKGQASDASAIVSVDPGAGMLRFTDRSITVPVPVSAVIRPID